jgi:ubiquinone/menaquinone biosynthesis C-methylase UbiE
LVAALIVTSTATVEGRIQRVFDRDKAMSRGRLRVAGLLGSPDGRLPAVVRRPAELEEHPVGDIDRTREHLIETYRKKAEHYDITSRLYPAPGYPERAQRIRAVRALGLRPGASVVDIACGTGLNFPLIEELVGPDGRIVGVDLTDAMLARAQQRIEANGWSNISLMEADAADFKFPTEVDAILSTYALTQVPGCAEVITHGAAALSGDGRWVVLDLKLPGATPRWLERLGTAVVRPFASIDEWIMRRPWDVIRVAMLEELADVSWTELFFGTAFLAAGSPRPGTGDGTN